MKQYPTQRQFLDTVTKGSTKSSIGVAYRTLEKMPLRDDSDYIARYLLRSLVGINRQGIEMQMTRSELEMTVVVADFNQAHVREAVDRLKKAKWSVEHYRLPPEHVVLKVKGPSHAVGLTRLISLCHFQDGL